MNITSIKLEIWINPKIGDSKIGKQINSEIEAEAILLYIQKLLENDGYNLLDASNKIDSRLAIFKK